MNSAISEVENGVSDTANKKARCSQVRAVAAFEMIELRLLADPKNAERQKAHEIDEHARRQRDHRPPKPGFAMDGGFGGRVQIEHQQRHRHGKDAVADGGEPFDALPGEEIIAVEHGEPLESIQRVLTCPRPRFKGRAERADG
jgi:hypothetical protein